MLAELSADNQHLTRSLRAAHEVCDRHNDVATASLIETGSTRPNAAPGFCGRQLRIVNSPGGSKNKEEMNRHLIRAWRVRRKQI